MNQVQEAKTQNALTEAASVDAWGVKEVSSNDLIIPQILVMQGMSKFVTERDAKMGEFRDSLSCDLLGDIEKNPLQLIPFHRQEVFSIEAMNHKGKYEYHSSVPIVKNPTNPNYNDNAPWEDTMLIDGKSTPIRRIRRYNFFVLNLKELEAGQPAMPYFISFKSTSVKEGKKLFNYMYVKNRMAGLSPAAYSFKISGAKKTNDEGTFVVLQVDLNGLTKQEHLNEAFKWFKTINQGAAKLHEEVDATSSSATGEF